MSVVGKNGAEDVPSRDRDGFDSGHRQGPGDRRSANQQALVAADAAHHEVSVPNDMIEFEAGIAPGGQPEGTADRGEVLDRLEGVRVEKAPSVVDHKTAGQAGRNDVAKIIPQPVLKLRDGYIVAGASIEHDAADLLRVPRGYERVAGGIEHV